MVFYNAEVISSAPPSLKMMQRVCYNAWKRAFLLTDCDSGTSSLTKKQPEKHLWGVRKWVDMQIWTLHILMWQDRTAFQYYKAQDMKELQELLYI